MFWGWIPSPPGSWSGPRQGLPWHGDLVCLLPQMSLVTPQILGWRLGDEKVLLSPTRHHLGLNRPSSGQGAIRGTCWGQSRAEISSPKRGLFPLESCSGPGTLASAPGLWKPGARPSCKVKGKSQPGPQQKWLQQPDAKLLFPFTAVAVHRACCGPVRSRAYLGHVTLLVSLQVIQCSLVYLRLWAGRAEGQGN